MKIFISYTTGDLDRFNISKIAVMLEQYKRIDRVFYWNRDATKDTHIIDYMEESIENCDVVIAICSEASKKSKPLKLELDMAIHLGKDIVPVFEDLKDVRLSLVPKRGVHFKRDNFDLFFQELYQVLTGGDLPSLVKAAEIIKRILVIEKVSGMMIFEYALLQDYEVDGDLVAGFIQAISSFGTELEGGRSDLGLEGIQFRGLSVVVNEGEYIRSVFVCNHNPDVPLRIAINNFTVHFEEKFKPILKKFVGDKKPFEDATDLVQEQFNLEIIPKENLED